MIASRARTFFLFCSGADQSILDRPECSAERGKYASIGATVFFTGLFAFVSGSYALSRVFHGTDGAVYLAVPLGLVWGLTIFNLDRLMVSGLRKSDSWWRQVAGAAPRLLMAVVIALVVAKPLEVRIFQDRIEAELDEMRIEQLESGVEGARQALGTVAIASRVGGLEEEVEDAQERRGQDPETQEFSELQASRGALASQLANAEQRIRSAQAEINRRRRQDRGYGSFLSRRASATRDAISLRSQVADVDREIEAARAAHRTTLDEEIARLSQTLSAKRDEQAVADSIAIASTLKTADSIDKGYTANFVAQLDALSRLTAERFSLMWWTGTMIMLLFLVVEVAPILVKLISHRGPYDDIIDAEEEAVRVSQQEGRDALAHLHREKNRLTSKHELEMHEEVLILQRDAELELAKELLQEWKQDELNKVRSSRGDGSASVDPLVPPVIKAAVTGQEVSQSM